IKQPTSLWKKSEGACISYFFRIFILDGGQNGVIYLKFMQVAAKGFTLHPDHTFHFQTKLD
ncbi:MAG: hypothetical protein AAGH79_18410, partial [Bacteroidota bacterium]